MPSEDSKSLPIASNLAGEKSKLDASVAEVKPTEIAASAEGISQGATASSSASERCSESVAGSAARLEDQTVSDLLAHFMRAPVSTWRRLKVAANANQSIPVHVHGAAEARLYPAPAINAPRPTLSLGAWSRKLATTERLRLYLYTLAILLAFLGSLYARGTPEIPRAGEFSLHFAAPYLWLGFILWLAADNFERYLHLNRSWREWRPLERFRFFAHIIPALLVLSGLHQLAQAMAAPSDSAGNLLNTAVLQLLGALVIWKIIGFVFRRAALWQGPIQPSQLEYRPPEIKQKWIIERESSSHPTWPDISRLRKLTIVFAAISSLYVWQNTAGNHISWSTISVWLLSISLWSFAFAPLRWNVFDWASGRIDVWRRITWGRHRWIIVCFAAIMLLGFVVRFADLETSPPQLIADHVENIKDVYNIRHHDYRPIVFTGYNSRDPLHNYLVVAFSYLTGMEISQYIFGLVAGLQGWLTLALLFWLGLEVMHSRPRKFRIIYSLLATALLAVSMWHFSMSRHGFRVTLCPLFLTSSLIFYLRALRHNHRVDYVKAGLLLGFGLLSYQAVQMLPIVYIAGTVLYLLFLQHSWRCRLNYALNLVILGFAAFVVFLPQMRYIVENPEVGLLRQSQEILGDHTTGDMQDLSIQQRFVLPFLQNLQKNLLRFHFYGSSNWAFGPRYQPSVDPLLAAFLLLGAAAWLKRIKSSDPAIMLVPLVFGGMLLVPALSIAKPFASLHILRASGAIPAVFLIAALPLALYLWHIHQTVSKPWGSLLALLIAAGAVLYAYDFNTRLYGGSFASQYLIAGHPHREAGQILRGFAESDGNYGNAFVVVSPHWWDTRAVGIEGGKPTFFNDPWPDTVPEHLKRALARSDDLRLDPELDLLFFYHRDNQEAANLLSRWFPAGKPVLHEMQLDSKSFYTYRVPAMGRSALEEFLAAHV